ncbi:MAG TPA: restriction endonuclease subunit S [Acidimicrobiales bacterium]|nr:restriction endonuclease subunit S [Acidimicrobiales bacterium]
MSDLPPGWEWTTIGEVAETSLGKMLDKKQATGMNPTPYLRNINVRWGTFDLSDLGEMDIRPDELDRVLASPGDVIACEGGEPGRAAVWRGPGTIALQKALHRIRPTEGIVPAYLALLLQHLALSRQLEHLFTGTTIKHLPQEKLRRVNVPLPPPSEQKRIVAAIEENLSRLDAGEAGGNSAGRRIKALEKAIITHASSTLDPPPHWRVVTVADAGTVGLGLQRSPRRHIGPNMRPYLRVANVFEDRIDDSHVMSMDMTVSEWGRYRLRDGDVLLNEGQSPEFLGRPAIYRGDPPEVAFTNSLIRFQANADVHPEWALLVFRSHLHNRRFMRESQITTNIAHLAAGRFKTVEFPVPPLDEQAVRVFEARARLDTCDRLRNEVGAGRKRAASLRRSILAAAFSGQLVPQDPDDEPASVLLNRIRAERTSTPRVKRARKARAS